jgi:DnaK suppressor protein
MATALSDVYEPRSTGFDQLILDENYRPSADEDFMCDEQRAYFLRKLKDWKESIILESRATMAQLQVDSMREPDVAIAHQAKPTGRSSFGLVTASAS